MYTVIASASPSYTGLEIFWFLVIAVLWSMYFLLEGFDFGIGMLLPFLSKDDLDRGTNQHHRPVWDGNEVWLLTAGGATFAAFPNWYATLFSGFYLPLFLILAALIFRAWPLSSGRSAPFLPGGRPGQGHFFWGSVIPSLLWGVAFANILRGVPIGPNESYLGSFFNLLNPYALLGVSRRCCSSPSMEPSSPRSRRPMHAGAGQKGNRRDLSRHFASRPVVLATREVFFHVSEREPRVGQLRCGDLLRLLQLPHFPRHQLLGRLDLDALLAILAWARGVLRAGLPVRIINTRIKAPWRRPAPRGRKEFHVGELRLDEVGAAAVMRPVIPSSRFESYLPRFVGMSPNRE